MTPAYSYPGTMHSEVIVPGTDVNKLVTSNLPTNT